MSIQATLRDDNTLELPEDAPRLAQTNTPLRVIDLGSGTFVVTESEPQIPSLAAEFRETLADAGISSDDLLRHLDTVKRELTREGNAQ